MTTTQVLAVKTAKYASRNIYGIRRDIPDNIELLKLLNRHMILEVLSNSGYGELTSGELNVLTEYIKLKS